jgi:hypothetical protein
MTTPSIPGQTASASSASGPQAQARAPRQAYHRRQTRAKAKSEALRHKEATHVEALPVLHPHAAGIDIGSRSHWVCVGFTTEAPSCLIREFPAHTAGLKAIAAFLREHQVTTIAMESTSIYWVPLYELLQAERFEVLLVDPSYSHQLKGRPKTDRRDCQWIYRLHSVGLLAAAFRPDEKTRAENASTRIHFGVSAPSALRSYAGAHRSIAPRRARFNSDIGRYARRHWLFWYGTRRLRIRNCPRGTTSSAAGGRNAVEPVLPDCPSSAEASCSLSSTSGCFASASGHRCRPATNRLPRRREGLLPGPLALRTLAAGPPATPRPDAGERMVRHARAHYFYPAANRATGRLDDHVTSSLPVGTSDRRPPWSSSQRCTGAAQRRVPVC